MNCNLRKILKFKFKHFILILALQFTLSGSFSQQKDSTFKDPYIVNLILDYKKLPDSSKSIVLEGLLDLTSFYGIHTTGNVIVKNQTLKGIIKNEFGFVTPSYNRFLMSEIASINKLADKDLILENSRLQLPLAPAIPSKFADYGYAQFIDFSNNTKKVIKVDSIFSETFQEDLNIQANTVGYWSYKITLSQLDYFKKTISDDLFKVISRKGLESYIDYGETPINYPLDQNAPAAVAVTKDTATIDLSSLADTLFGDFYILDYIVRDKCTHGMQVLNVVSQTLSRYGLHGLIPNKIKLFPVNVKEDPRECKRIVSKYYDKVISLGGNNDRSIHEKKKSFVLKTIKKVKCDSCTTAPYVNVLLKQLYTEQPDVITTSFTIQGFDEDLFPEVSDRSGTVLITCASNLSIPIEDLFGNTNNNMSGRVEPLNKYYQNYPSGCIIVGSQTGKGAFSSQFSKNGNRVSVLGKGSGWAKQDACSPTMTGTSFATPEVATLLYIAKASWRKHKQVPDLKTIRNRMMLATDLDTNFLGKFASAGPIDMHKLLQFSPYVVTTKGTFIAIDSVKGYSTCRIGVSTQNNDKATNFFFAKYSSSNKPPELFTSSSFMVKDGSYYLFNNNNEMWEKKDCINYNLRFWNTETGQFETYDSIEDFNEKYSQIVIL